MTHEELVRQAIFAQADALLGTELKLADYLRLLNAFDEMDSDDEVVPMEVGWIGDGEWRNGSYDR